jgi:hypothetical protein
MPDQLKSAPRNITKIICYFKAESSHFITSEQACYTVGCSVLPITSNTFWPDQSKHTSSGKKFGPL